jgi:hypothetical protein
MERLMAQVLKLSGNSCLGESVDDQTLFILAS